MRSPFISRTELLKRRFPVCSTANRCFRLCIRLWPDAEPFSGRRRISVLFSTQPFFDKLKPRSETARGFRQDGGRKRCKIAARTAAKNLQTGSRPAGSRIGIIKREGAFRSGSGASPYMRASASPSSMHCERPSPSGAFCTMRPSFPHREAPAAVTRSCQSRIHWPSPQP